VEKTTLLVGNDVAGGISEFAISVAPDWPMILLTGLVGLTSLFTSWALIKVTKQNQLSISNNKQAEMRLEWLDHLRTSISEVVALCLITNSKVREVASYRNSEQYFSDWQKILTLLSKIKLLLTNGKTESKVLYALIEDMVAEAIDIKSNSSDFVAFSCAVEDISVSLIEKTWEQIKLDLEK